LKLSVIMPAHNEEETIDEVIAQVLAVELDDGELELIVVDDASTDSTPRKLEAYADDPRMVVLRHERNRGKGGAIRTGLAKATGDVTVIQDADLEYDPSELPGLVTPLVAGRADFVYGSRFRGTVENMRFENRLANKILSLVATLLFFRRVTDEATCYKVFWTNDLRSFDLKCERFEFCPEVTAKALKRHMRMLEIPITYKARTVEAGKKIRAFDGLEAVWTLLRYRFSG
jgi:glycosyltransferase involved in cell wall biosynthesis